MEYKEIKNGSHFWALMDGELLVVMKNNSGLLFVCGDWEGAVNFDDLTFVELIEKPASCSNIELYYQ